MFSSGAKVARLPLKIISTLNVSRILKKCTDYTFLHYTKSACPQITADPVFPNVDEKTHFIVHGLDPGALVTITAQVADGSSPLFMSHAHYQVDRNGQIDLSKQPSLGGSYKGVEPMGLLWSLKGEEGARIGSVLGKRDVTTPYKIRINILNDHLTIRNKTDIDSGQKLCYADHYRSYMASGVKRIPIREGRLRGTLFLPGTHNGPFPGVISMHGTGGGLNETTAALLASNGYASLSLAFFRYQDLVKTLDLDMEYFEEAVDWFTSLSCIKGNGIGVSGLSYGSNLAMYMAIYSHKVKAVVSINGPFCYAFAKQYKGRKRMPTMWPDVPWGCMEETPEGYIFRENFWKEDIPDDCIVPVEKAEQAKYLFIDGEDDMCSHTKHNDLMIARLQYHGKANYKKLRYAGAGHAIHPPYTPCSRLAYHSVAGRLVIFGGNIVQHAAAQEDSWKEILQFYKECL